MIWTLSQPWAQWNCSIGEDADYPRWDEKTPWTFTIDVYKRQFLRSCLSCRQSLLVWSSRRKEREWCEPVSYTHLWKVKRRCHRWEKRWIEAPVNGGRNSESLATFFTQKDPASKVGNPLFFNDLEVPELWAVSYTHLDVYKRQIEGNPILYTLIFYLFWARM